MITALIGALVTIPIGGAGAAFPGQSSSRLGQNAKGPASFQMRPNGTDIAPIGPWSDVNLFRGGDVARR